MKRRVWAIKLNPSERLDLHFAGKVIHGEDDTALR
jgi:hypothetical protein